MRDMELVAVRDALRDGRVSPVELVDELLAAIRAENGALRAYAAVDETGARAQALAAEQALRGGAAGPLAGVPVAVKDVFTTAGMPTGMGTAPGGTPALREDSAMVSRLRAAGAVILGKLTTHELAYGPTGDYSYGGAARNPHDRDRMPGGSSSGAGVAVAARLAFGAFGSDTGGSVRIPASCCGVVGLKPTYGLLSRYGLLPLAPGMDHAGILARSAADVAALLDAVAGYDPRDPASRQAPPGPPREVRRVGVLGGYFRDGVAASVLARFDSTVEGLRAAGVRVEPREVPDAEAGARAGRTALAADALGVHRGLLAEGRLGDEIAGRLRAAEEITAADYFAALRTGRELYAAILRALDGVDVLVCPTLAVSPPPVGERSTVFNGETVPTFPLLTRFTGLFNLTGFPAASVPCGVDEHGLPVGLQIVGRPFDDVTVLAAAGAVERVQH